ncbi:MAG: UbiA family prenyltransferase [Candidatus Rokubacteria bacterium]|nr:UbiA family prenyltransferase [Candidatus Rokubacteria bacterium]
MADGHLVEAATVPMTRGGRAWLDYLRPLRFDHWIKNLVVPVGSTLALVAHGTVPTPEIVWVAILAFVLSGCVSSVNYAINEILDAPFDARHPVKRARPIPSGRVRVWPLLIVTALLGVGAFVAAIWLFPPLFAVASFALFVAGLIYNLPPIRLKDWPYLDAVVESLTNPIRLAIGWYAVASTQPAHPPLFLLAAVWAFGAFLMTGKRLAELRLLGELAARYRPTFKVYSIPALLGVQLGYAVLGLLALAGLFAAERPGLLPSLPFVALVVAWTLKMTFEPQSPLIDPEHLYRRPVFLLLALGIFAALVVWAVG